MHKVFHTKVFPHYANIDISQIGACQRMSLYENHKLTMSIDVCVLVH